MSIADPSAGRPDLVPALKAMTLQELSAYCTAVLEERAGDGGLLLPRYFGRNVAA